MLANLANGSAVTSTLNIAPTISQYAIRVKFNNSTGYSASPSSTTQFTIPYNGSFTIPTPSATENGVNNKTLTYTFANATVSGEAKTNYTVPYSFAPTYKYKQTNRSPDSPTTLVEITPEFEENYMVVKFFLNGEEIKNESILVDKGISLQGVGGDRGWNSSTSKLLLSYTYKEATLIKELTIPVSSTEYYAGWEQTNNGQTVEISIRTKTYTIIFG